MRQMEDDMSNRSKPILTFLLCAAIIGSYGCTTTTPKAGPTQTTMAVHEISQDGTVVKRNITLDLPKVDRRRPAWQRKVARVLHASIMIYANPSLAPVYIAAAMKNNRR